MSSRNASQIWRSCTPARRQFYIPTCSGQPQARRPSHRCRVSPSEAEDFVYVAIYDQFRQNTSLIPRQLNVQSNFATRALTSDSRKCYHRYISCSTLSRRQKRLRLAFFSGLIEGARLTGRWRASSLSMEMAVYRSRRSRRFSRQPAACPARRNSVSFAGFGHGGWGIASRRDADATGHAPAISRDFGHGSAFFRR